MVASLCLQVETGKKTLILHGTKTSSTLNAVLTEIYNLKKDSAVKYSRKNENIRPFESGGETSLEFFSRKTDCSIFVVSLQGKDRDFTRDCECVYFSSTFFCLTICCVTPTFLRLDPEVNVLVFP